MTRARWMGAACLVALAVGCAPVAPEPPPDPDLLLLRGATLIDPARRRVIEGGAVAIRGDRIEGVYEAGAELPAAGQVRDLDGRFVLPGFVDTHAHVTVLVPGDGGLRYDREASEGVLRLLLAAGVTLVRNPAAPTAAGVALRDALASGAIPGPRVVTSGEALNRTRAPFGPFVAVRDEEQVRAEVRRQAAAGVDWIKVYSTLAPPLVAAAVDEAHRHGLPVVGHLQRTTWTAAARAGIDAVTHAAPWSREYLPAEHRERYAPTILGRLDWLEHVDPRSAVVREMRQALVDGGVAVDPTLVALVTKFRADEPAIVAPAGLDPVPAVIVEAWRQGGFAADWNAGDHRRARALWPRVLEWTRDLYESGVTLTSGSDTPNPWVVPGQSLHDELTLLVDAGIPTMAVLEIATVNGCRALGFAAECGTIEPGRRADLVILSSNPLADIRHTRSVETVILGGAEYDPARLRGAD